MTGRAKHFEIVGPGRVFATTRVMGQVGYARVSTPEQRQVPDCRLDALEEAGCERVLENHALGAGPERPNFAACLITLRTDELLVARDRDQRTGEHITFVYEVKRSCVIEPSRPQSRRMCSAMFG